MSHKFENPNPKKLGNYHSVQSVREIVKFSANSAGRRTIRLGLGWANLSKQNASSWLKTWHSNSDVNIFVSWTQYDDILKDRNRNLLLINFSLLTPLTVHMNSLVGR